MYLAGMADAFMCLSLRAIIPSRMPCLFNTGPPLLPPNTSDWMWNSCLSGVKELDPTGGAITDRGLKSNTGCYGDIFHRRIVPSELPLASVLPSGLNATLLTALVCPVSVCLCSPVTASHRRIVLSSLPLASVRPSGLNDTLLTHRVCPVSRAIS